MKVPGFGNMAALLLLTSMAQTTSSVVYNIQSSQSRIEVAVFRGGLLKAVGHDHKIAVKSFSGEVRLDPMHIEGSFVDLSIDSASLTVLNDPNLSEKDRKQVQADMQASRVLNVQDFPKITFHSTGAANGGKSGEAINLKGKLNIRGIIKEISFPVHVHPDRNFLHVTGTVEIAQSDFGIKPITAAAGTIRVKDRVNVEFDIVAERAD